MGRFDPVHSEQTKTEFIRLITEDNLTTLAAADRAGIPHETARKYWSQHLIYGWPRIDDEQHPAASIARRMLNLISRELYSIEGPRNPKGIDIGRVERMAKVIKELAAVADKHPAKPADKPDSPLAGMLNGNGSA